MKKIKILIIGFMLSIMLSVPMTVNAEEIITEVDTDNIIQITTKNYKDEDLYNYMITLDTDKNSYLSKSELKGHTGWIEINNKYFNITAEGLPRTGYYQGSKYNYYFTQKGVMKTGWIKDTNGKYMYFDSETGRQLHNKWIKYKNNTYYVDKNGYMITGWLEYKGNTYYLKSDGRMVTKWNKIGKYYYYFSPNTGKMLSEKWIYYKKVWYYVNAKGRMKTNAWIEYKNHWYRVDADGKMISNKKVKIGSKQYYFDKNGRMASDKVVTIDKNLYYASTSGAIITKTGWHEENKNVYLIGTGGKLTINKLAKYNGTYYYMRPTGRGELLRNQTAARVADSLNCSLPAAMKYAGGLKYTGKNSFTDAMGTYKLANYGFSTHSGNCYVYAATLTELAYAMGYDVRQVRGCIRLSWGWGNNHSWVEIKKDGKTYVCDPAGLHQLGWNNAYMFQYGQKGTWMYKDPYEIKY